MTLVSNLQSLMGRAWHRDMVLGSWTDNSGLVKKGSESQESEGVVDTSGVI